MAVPGFIKIGISNKPKSRRSGVQTSNPHHVCMLGWFDPECDDFDVEQALHHRFRQYAAPGGHEWFVAADPIFTYMDDVLGSADSARRRAIVNVGVEPSTCGTAGTPECGIWTRKAVTAGMVREAAFDECYRDADQCRMREFSRRWGEDYRHGSFVGGIAGARRYWLWPGLSDGRAA